MQWQTIKNSEPTKIINRVFENRMSVIHDSSKHEMISDTFMDNSKIISKGISDFHEYKKLLRK